MPGGTFVYNESASNPFLHGPMNRAGKHFALLLLRMVVRVFREVVPVVAGGWRDVRKYEKGNGELPALLDACGVIFTSQHNSGTP